MAGSDGFRTAPLGFDKNDVNNYISKLVQRLKASEHEKNEAKALASKTKEMKENYEKRISEQEEIIKNKLLNNEAEIKSYQTQIKELEQKISALQLELEKRQTQTMSVSSDTSSISDAEQIITEAKFNAHEIIESAKRERQRIVENIHYLLNIISSENKAIDSAFNSIKRGLENCIYTDLKAEFPQIEKHVENDSSDLGTQANTFADQNISAEPRQAIQTEPQNTAQTPDSELNNDALHLPSVQETEASYSNNESDDLSESNITDVKKEKAIESDLSYNADDIFFTESSQEIDEPTKIDYPDSKPSFVDYDDDLSELFAPTDDDSSKIGATPDFDNKILAEQSPTPTAEFESIIAKSDEEELKSTNDDLSKFFTTTEDKTDDIIDNTVDFTQMDNDVNEQDFEVKPLEPEQNIFDSLWDLNSDDSEDDEMSSDNIGIMDL